MKIQEFFSFFVFYKVKRKHNNINVISQQSFVFLSVFLKFKNFNKKKLYNEKK